MIRQLFFSIALLFSISSIAQVTDHKPAQYNVNGILWQQQ